MRKLSVFLVLLATAAARGDQPKVPEAVSYDWRAFGQKMAAALPAATRDGPLPARVRYLADQFARELVRLDIAPNFDNKGRERAQQRYGPTNTSIGTCGHTSNSFLEYLHGAGIPPRHLQQRVGLKLRFREGRLTIALELNADHVATVLLADKEALVFDFWMHGRKGDTFAEFATSMFNGMPQADWDKLMKKEHYAGPWYKDDEAYQKLFKK